MKKLLIAIVSLSAVILMSSCTTDSIGDTEKETSSKYTKLSVSATDEVIPPPIDDRDKTKGLICC